MIRCCTGAWNRFHTLPNSVPSADTAIYIQAIRLAVLAIGLLLIAIFGVLVVMLFPEKERIETP